MIVYVHGIFFSLIGLKFHYNLKKHLIVMFTFTCVFQLDTFWLIYVLSVHFSWKERHVWGCLSLFDVLTGCLFLPRKHCKHHVCWINIKQTESVWRCVYTDYWWVMVWGWRTVVLSSTWTPTIISILSTSINFCPCP